MMLAFRALFWFGIVCALVPFKQIDLTRGELEIDRTALMERVAGLPSYCQRNADICDRAGALLEEAAKTGSRLADQVAIALQDRIRQG